MNNKKPIIGILGSVDLDSKNNTVIYALDKIRIAIIEFGGIPIMIIPTQKIFYGNYKSSEVPTLTNLEKEDLYKQVDLCDGIIIPGGSKWYEYDEVITKYAFLKDIPILGICRGMQLLASINNEDKIIVKNDTVLNHYCPNQKYTHYVDIVSDTYLNKILNVDKINVNSRHLYHVDKTNNFIVSAYSTDGIIEAIECKDKKFVIGVQWHPESLIDDDIYAKKIFIEFINKCRGV